MGHDTFAWRDEAHATSPARLKDDPEISYLRRSMGCRDRGLIYEALGPRAAAHYAGVSGDGSRETFTKAELRRALARIPDLPDNADQREFLRECIERGGETVVIGFY